MIYLVITHAKLNYFRSMAEFFEQGVEKQTFDFVIHIKLYITNITDSFLNNFSLNHTNHNEKMDGYIHRTTRNIKKLDRYGICRSARKTTNINLDE